MRGKYLVALFAALLIPLLAIAPAFAVKPAAPIQTPLSPTKIPQFAQPLNTLANGLPVALGSNITVNICEAQSQILPAGTPVVGAVPGVAPLTWTWGYQVDPAGGATPCNLNPGHSYLGPVAVAVRHTPTQLTMVNKLPDVASAKVLAYTTSTDQTLIWGDPLSMDRAGVFGINGAVPYPYPLAPDPEGNDCWKAAQEFGAGLIAPMPAPCLNNYGFLGPQSVATPPATYAAPIPAAVHIHGGEVPSVLDGGPDAWWTPNGIYGHGYYTRNVVALPIFQAAASTFATLPALPASVPDAALIVLPDAGYPAGRVVFDQLTSAYLEVSADGLLWVAATVTYPLGTVVFNQDPAAFGLNTNNANVWTLTPPAADAIYEIVDQTPANAGRLAYAYEHLAGAWSSVSTFPVGTLVQLQGIGTFHQSTGAGWVEKTSIDRATYVYPNGQEAAPVWFHDHMLGATRLNVYAGIAGGYYLIDPATPLAAGMHPFGLDTDGNGSFADANGNLQLNEFVVPLIIQDRMFDTKGQLFFPNVGINPEHPFWIPEFVGDTILVNGKAWPFMNVEPRRYKFLVLNGSNARAYELYLMSKTTGLKGPAMWVVTNDQGYLDTAQKIDPNVKPGKLAIMPGERYEIIVDFTGLAGQVIEMRNTARTPYVGGAPVNGTTTGKIVQFRVSAAPVADSSFNPALTPVIRTTNPIQRLTDPLLGTVMPNVTVHKTRRLTLNEVIGAGGPLEVLVNNTLYDGSKPRPYTDFTSIGTMWNNTWYSELPHEGETELWEIVNLTADAHPMHPHLVAFQVLNRQGLDILAYNAGYTAAYIAAGMFDPVTGLPFEGYGPPMDYNCGLGAPRRGVLSPATCVLGGNPDPALVPGSLLGLPVPPMPQEIGWKDTVQALPNMVTRFLVRFAKPDLAPNAAAATSGYDFSPNGGHGYVWHCHIVDHEDNEMMRPYTVYANPGVTHDYVMGFDY